jgi:hypothetical protein
MCTRERTGSATTVDVWVNELHTGSLPTTVVGDVYSVLGRGNSPGITFGALDTHAHARKRTHTHTYTAAVEQVSKTQPCSRANQRVVTLMPRQRQAALFS